MQLVVHHLSNFGDICWPFALSRPSIVTHPKCGVLRDCGCVRWQPICLLFAPKIGWQFYNACMLALMCLVEHFMSARVVLEYFWSDFSTPQNPAPRPMGQVPPAMIFLCYEIVLHHVSKFGVIYWPFALSRPSICPSRSSERCAPTVMLRHRVIEI
jgi:hypothetical protein